MKHLCLSYSRVSRCAALALALALAGCGEPQPDSEVATAVEAPLTLEQLRKKYPEREYISENNYIIYVENEYVSYGHGVELDFQYGTFPQYHIDVAKEWPREDLEDESSYDMPRFQFAWANAGGYGGPDSEEGLKLWSMKTDGTDLRLITDNVNDGNIETIVRSPDNRLIAWSGNSGSKTVYNLETGETTLVSPNGAPSLTFSEDSRYLYFRRSGVQSTQRWDSHTGEITASREVNIGKIGASASISFGGKRFTVLDFAVRVSDDKTHEHLFNLAYDRNEPDNHTVLETRAISPTGRYAWGSNSSYGYLFDTEEQTVTRTEGSFYHAQILGKDARYSAVGRITSMTIHDRKLNKVWTWRRFGSGRVSIHGRPSLYNGLANDGMWFKETE
ncbi:TolB family protein [Vibrio sp. WXL210]|uniref:TolB family protein n=1 Tax=Vibrio sp. WXL210 TaxID=3450709 RepID=UPI003EC8E6DF